jgi:hypothetical protein
MVLLPPFDVCRVVLGLLTALIPHRHLIILILSIGCIIRVLGQLDVQALHLFRVIIVSSAEQVDGWNIVKEAVDLRQIEMLSHADIEKHVLVAVELREGIVEAAEGGGHMRWELCQEDKVEEGTCGSNHMQWHLPTGKRSISDETKEKSAHSFVLFPRNV